MAKIIQFDRVKKRGKSQKRPSGITSRDTVRRMLGMAGVMALLFIVTVFKLLSLMVIDSEEYQKRANDQQLYDTVVPAKRGTIYDANMEPLVQSSTAWVVTLNTNYIDEKIPGKKDAVIKKLSEVLGLSEEYIRERMEIKLNEVRLKGKADKNQHDEILAFMTANEIKGINMLTDTQRTYSSGSLASTVLGFTNADNEGVIGVEAQYNTQLSGVDGRVVEAKNANGGAMTAERNILVNAQDGNSLVLTIDSYCQSVLEKYLMQAVRENDIRNRATGILMNVNTGAVLAMSSMPDYDPSDYLAIKDAVKAQYLEELKKSDPEKYNTELGTAQWAQWRNKAISDTYEPGSVFKPVTMSAALEEGVTNLGDSFYCPGYKMVGGIKRNCHKTAGHGAESLTQAMMNSCNPVFMELGVRLGGTGFYKYYQAFGFTAKTGIDLPDEAVGIFHSESSLNEHSADLAAASFGQTNTVTPIQMITAISAISNGGYLVQPHVVAQIRDSSGNVISNTETQIKRQVISSQTSDMVNGMLEKVVSGGTAKNGYIAGYRIGGKTGTSEKLAETAATGMKTYVASFCAIAPSDDPEIALLIVLDDPRGDMHMGGTIAAPVARNVLSDVLDYLGVETIYSADDVAALEVKTPVLVGKSVGEAEQMLKDKGLKIKVIGEGDTVSAQIPPAGQNIPKNGTVVVSTESDGEVPMVTVPYVVGKSPSSANSAIVGAKLNIRYGGTGFDSSQGVAVSQSIPAGTEVEQGTVVKVDFIVSGSTD